MTALHPFRRAAAIVAACAALATALVALVVSQSQPARAAASMGEFTFAASSGKLTDPEPFGPSLTTPAACPDYEVRDENGNVVEAVPINYTLMLRAVMPGGGSVGVMGSVISASPYDTAKTASLAAADNPDLNLPADLTQIFTADGTYELQLVCLDDFGGEHPDGNYWTQKITVTGENWAVGEGAESTSVSLTGQPSDVEPGQKVEFSATIAPAEATGTVTFREGGTTIGSAPVSGGKAEFTTSDLPQGQHAVVAAFTPDDASNWGASESAPFTVSVFPPDFEIRDASGERLPDTPELRRGQTVELIVRGCAPGTAYAMSMRGNDAEFPDATADAEGVVTWKTLTVPEDAVAGRTAWDFEADKGCRANGGIGADVASAPFTVPEPSSESPSGSPTDDPSGDPTDDPSGDPSGDPSASADPSGDPSGTTGGSGTGGTGTSGGTGGTGGTSPTGGLASTGSQVALFGGLGAVLLTAGGVFAMRFARRNGLLGFGQPGA
ncbi:Ig-like domain-containing protein [Streptomyces sp. NPDC018972]|uniref:Ig-like domain-containing protein n=1 Tax=Streptomyces sp. NPDC018972 TaxID=3365060 RepID=UPI00378941EF